MLLATKARVPWGISQNWPNIVTKPTNLTGYTLSEWVLVHGIAHCGWWGGCSTPSLRDPGSPSSSVKIPGRLDRLWRDRFAQLRFHKVKVRRSEVWPWVWVAWSPLWPRLLLKGSCPFSNSQTSMWTWPDDLLSVSLFGWPTVLFFLVSRTLWDAGLSVLKLGLSKASQGWVGHSSFFLWTTQYSKKFGILNQYPTY